MDAGLYKRTLQMAVDFLRKEDEVDELFARMCYPTYYDLPDPPVYAAACLSALLPDPDDAVDRVSRLPDALLRNIVSRLPVKDAACTAALSRRWRGVWRSAPLVLVDAHLFPFTSLVSSVLDAHPGPFRCIHLTSGYTEEFLGLLASWLQILAVKGIQELVLVNCMWPLQVDLPANFVGMATLTSLYLGLWKFPDTAGLPRATCFRNLRELALCSVLMESRDLDFILDRSPVLETLFVEASLFQLRLRLVSQSLQCVQIVRSFFEEIFVVDAPLLEQLIHFEAWSPRGSCIKVKIGHAPKLHLLELDARHILEVGNTIIKADTTVRPNIMVPSVRIFALEVCPRVRKDAKMIPVVLKCFPNVEALHIKFGETYGSTGKLNIKNWHESGKIECLRSSIKQMVFHDFRWCRSELTFLKFFFESALVLKEVVILLAADFTSMEELQSKMASLDSMKRASAFSLLVDGPEVVFEAS